MWYSDKKKVFFNHKFKTALAIYCLIIMRSITLVFVSYPNIHCWPTFRQFKLLEHSNCLTGYQSFVRMLYIFSSFCDN